MNEISLSEFIKLNNAECIEGFSRQIPRQVKILEEYATNAKEILEIGFNAGHSADTFLQANPHVNVTSFDLGTHNVTPIGKTYIDTKYPDRHTLILGDSTVTIPNFIKNTKETNKKYDIIFIDGGHDYEVAFADLLNCRELSHADSIVLMDDTIYTDNLVQVYTIGPTKAWVQGLKENIIIELGREEWEVGRGMSWGRYCGVPRST